MQMAWHAAHDVSVMLSYTAHVPVLWIREGVAWTALRQQKNIVCVKLI